MPVFADAEARPFSLSIHTLISPKVAPACRSGHFKSVVTKPQNVFVLRDVSCAGYVAGGNCDFFTLNKDGTPKGKDLASKEIMERLSFANDVSARYPSMLAFPMTKGDYDSGKMDTVMSVTNRLLPWEVTIAGGGEKESFPGGQAMFEKYSKALNLGQVHYGEDMKAAENQARRAAFS